MPIDAEAYMSGAIPGLSRGGAWIPDGGVSRGVGPPGSMSSAYSGFSSPPSPSGGASLDMFTGFWKSPYHTGMPNQTGPPGSAVNASTSDKVNFSKAMTNRLSMPGWAPPPRSSPTKPFGPPSPTSHSRTPSSRGSLSPTSPKSPSTFDQSRASVPRTSSARSSMAPAHHSNRLRVDAFEKDGVWWNSQVGSPRVVLRGGESRAGHQASVSPQSPSSPLINKKSQPSSPHPDGPRPPVASRQSNSTAVGATKSTRNSNFTSLPAVSPYRKLVARNLRQVSLPARVEALEPLEEGSSSGSDTSSRTPSEWSRKSRSSRPTYRATSSRSTTIDFTSSGSQGIRPSTELPSGAAYDLSPLARELDMVEVTPVAVRRSNSGPIHESKSDSLDYGYSCEEEDEEDGSYMMHPAAPTSLRPDTNRKEPATPAAPRSPPPKKEYIPLGYADPTRQDIEVNRDGPAMKTYGVAWKRHYDGIVLPPRPSGPSFVQARPPRPDLIEGGEWNQSGGGH